MSLAGQIAVVTGASRGIGRGVALQLGEAGATVYITGRKPAQSGAATDNYLPTLEKTAKEITERGGKGIPAYVDHSNMDEVKEFFSKLEQDHNGQLDILVNNAYAAVKTIMETAGKPFYECPPDIWDEVNNVGLRNHYYCSVYASRIMVKNGSGLIVNISSAGGLRYLFNIPYGVGKEALDRMSADMAVELKPKNVCVVSLWPGAVRTEMVTNMMSSPAKTNELANVFKDGETIEYPGKAIVAIASDDRRMEKTGRTLITADIGNEYGFLDTDGRKPPNLRSLSYLLSHTGHTQAAQWVPSWVKIPGWFLWASSSRL
ncbi:oxidoreductase, short chain dehydrogenase/reductase family protein [Necator americanus]|uniref:Oxidoreductase, short chain dehydrogenase/reductase family protein n=1 Tax=Necator americanus TaxID=51031 RepID=W2T4R9_NECAM|nr:oxidoreductase, short chain dehydrogenase/reductase family protein [Necator americanus]ETN75952.1 oxidoreductase, short chain dehydrogenase/reductase family protein [Necator americanus]